VLLFFDDEIINLIIDVTNKSANVRVQQRKTWHNIDREKMKCFLGLLYLAGVLQAKDELFSEMWSLCKVRNVVDKLVNKSLQDD